MKTLLQQSKSILIARGIFSILLGICIFAFPISTSVAFSFIVGIAGALYGLYVFIFSFYFRKKHKNWWILMAEGLLGIILGVMIIIWPMAAIFAITVLIACWMIIMGLITIFQSFGLRKEIKNEIWYILSGIVVFLAGILMIYSPAVGTSVIVYLIGAAAIVYGVLLFLATNKIKDTEKDIEQVEKKIYDAFKENLDE